MHARAAPALRASEYPVGLRMPNGRMVSGQVPRPPPWLRYHRGMQHDILGNPVAAMREPAMRAVDDFVEGFLGYESRAEGIVAAADADPECCIANVYAGFMWMLLEAPEAAQRASRYLAAAERAASTRAAHPDGGAP